MSRQVVSLDETVGWMLSVLRQHLGMAVSFISEFAPDNRHIRYVSSEGEQEVVRAGDKLPFEVGNCLKIVTGEMPALVRDTGQPPAVSHIGVPLWTPEGGLYGTLCCFSSNARPDLTERDVQLVRAFADMFSKQLGRTWDTPDDYRHSAQEIRAVIGRNEPRMVFQPIVRLADGQVEGFESLARFDGQSGRSTEAWFQQAEQIGLHEGLESNAVRNSLASLKRIPAGYFLSVNCRPTMVSRGLLRELLAGYPGERVMIELSEKELVRDFGTLSTSLEQLRAAGVRTAMDDAGAGFSSLQHLIDLRPDVIKLDISLALKIREDRTTRAMVAAIVAFAHETGAQVIAEGIEEKAAADVYRELGVDSAQGYWFARPDHLDAALLRASSSTPHQ